MVVARRRGRRRRQVVARPYGRSRPDSRMVRRARRHRTRRRSAGSRSRTRGHGPRRAVYAGRRASGARPWRTLYSGARRHVARRTLHSGPRGRPRRALYAGTRSGTRRRGAHRGASARAWAAASRRGAGVRHRRGREHEQREHCGYELFHFFRSFLNFICSLPFYRFSPRAGGGLPFYARPPVAAARFMSSAGAEFLAAGLSA